MLCTFCYFVTFFFLYANIWCELYVLLTGKIISLLSQFILYKKKKIIYIFLESLCLPTCCSFDYLTKVSITKLHIICFVQYETNPV